MTDFEYFYELQDTQQKAFLVRLEEHRFSVMPVITEISTNFPANCDSVLETNVLRNENVKCDCCNEVISLKCDQLILLPRTF